MAEAYLEKPNNEFKEEEEEEEWGTTNIAIIANEGCDGMYAATDSRTTSSKRKAFITGEESQKFLHMKSCNVFATMAGHVDHCHQMLAHINECFEHRKVYRIGDVPEEVKRYMKSWEKIWKQKLDGYVLMAGWWDKVPYIYNVNRSGLVLEKSKSKLCEAFVNGSGGPHVLSYLNDCMSDMKVSSSEELLENVKRALLYATLFDEHSGGYVRVFRVTKEDVVKEYDRPVLAALVDNYNALDGYLSKSLFFLFDNQDYAYTHEINVEVDKGFERQFQKEYIGNVVLKQGATYIVRLVHFENPIDKLYENLKRKNSQRIVPREVQHLLSVEIEEIGEAPILCGKSTEELVRILEHL